MSQCQSWTYHDDGSCYLHDQTEPVRVEANVTSGVPRGTLPPTYVRGNRGVPFMNTCARTRTHITHTHARAHKLAPKAGPEGENGTVNPQQSKQFHPNLVGQRSALCSNPSLPEFHQLPQLPQLAQWGRHLVQTPALPELPAQSSSSATARCQWTTDLMISSPGSTSVTLPRN